MTLRKIVTTLLFFGIGAGLFWLAMSGVEDREGMMRDMRSALGNWRVVSHGIPRHRVSWHAMEALADTDGAQSFCFSVCACRGFFLFGQCAGSEVR